MNKRRMLSGIGAVMMTLGMTGCGGKGAKASQGDSAALGAMKRLKDEMCACKDKACVEKVTAALATMGDKQPTIANMTDDQKKAARVVNEELTKCMSKAMGTADAPVAPPTPTPPTPTPPTPTPPSPPPPTPTP